MNANVTRTRNTIVKRNYTTLSRQLSFMKSWKINIVSSILSRRFRQNSTPSVSQNEIAPTKENMTEKRDLFFLYKAVVVVVILIYLTDEILGDDFDQELRRNTFSLTTARKKWLCST